MKQPALGMIEFKSIARGVKTADAMIKKAPIHILETHPICPGKYMILFCGEVADVEESLAEGISIGGDMVINDLIIPHLHKQIIPALTGTNPVENFKSLGIVETFSIASCVVAADKAVKMAQVELVEIRLANGLGGKAYFVMTGELYDVEASIQTAVEHIKEEGMLAASEIIQNPHPVLIEKGVYF